MNAPLAVKPPSTTGHLPYRKDLDGLRAIAVLSVVFYHLNAAWVPGGFLGVDIFYVLSGYFITGIIVSDLAAGKFTYAGFYERRVRRIMPALLTLLTVVIAAGYLILLPVDYEGLGRSALATLAFVANIYFWRDTNYFARAAHDKPLLHMWSLGVEEQFYIFMPVLLVLLFRWYRRGMFPAVAAVVAASLIVDVVLLRRGLLSTEFYLLPSRAWELGAGALLALSGSAAAAPVSSRASLAQHAASILGLLLLPLAFWQPLIAPAVGLPAPLLAVAATALLVWSGRGATVATWLLGLRPMVAIGLLSYSLYLWHWPVIVYMQYVRVRPLEPGEAAIAFALMLACAWISWRIIEKPFRGKMMPRGRVYRICGAGALLVAVAAIAILAAGGVTGRFPPRADAIASAANTHFRCPIADSITVGGVRGCSLGLPDRDPARADVVLLGNSHALMYAPLLKQLLAERGRSGMVLFVYSCPPLTSVNIPVCKAGSDAAVAAAVASSAPVVMVATNWRVPPHFAQDDGRPFAGSGVRALTAGLDATIDRLVAAGKKVVLVGPLNEPLWDVPSEASRRISFDLPERPLFVDRAIFEKRFATAIAHFAARPDIRFMPVDGAQCPGATCDFVRGDLSLFSDDTHLSRQALPLFRPYFERSLDAVLPPKGQAR